MLEIKTKPLYAFYETCFVIETFRLNFVSVYTESSISYKIFKWFKIMFRFTV